MIDEIEKQMASMDAVKKLANCAHEHRTQLQAGVIPEASRIGGLIDLCLDCGTWIGRDGPEWVPPLVAELLKVSELAPNGAALDRAQTARQQLANAFGVPGTWVPSAIVGNLTNAAGRIVGEEHLAAVGRASTRPPESTIAAAKIYLGLVENGNDGEPERATTAAAVLGWIGASSIGACTTCGAKDVDVIAQIGDARRAFCTACARAIHHAAECADPTTRM